jgi:hypothetical protein
MGKLLNLESIMNSDGSIAVGSTGFKYAIDTLTAHKDRIIQQKFYEVAPADFMPVDVGTNAFSDEIVQNLSFSTGGDFFEGDADTAEGNGNIATVGAAMGNVRMPSRLWNKQIVYTVVEIEKAMRAGNWDPVTEKLRSQKKNWDLGIQKVAFLGHPRITGMTGLLNSAEVKVDTTVLPAKISAMTAAQFTTMVSKILGEYHLNSNGTSMPDTFVIPTADYLGLGVPYTDAYPNISRLQFLLDLFRGMTANPNFRILPLSYAEATRNASSGLNKNRYVLYKNDPETLAMNIPVDLTVLNPGTTNNFQFSQVAYGQYSGVLIPRKREVIYFDAQS